VVERRARPLEEACIDVAHLYLPVGGAWLCASRLGMRPMDFSDSIVLLTGVHFHYAGTAAPLLAGMAGRALAEARAQARSSPRADRAFVVAAAAAISGPPLVAIGISVSRAVEVISAVLLAAGLAVLAAIAANLAAPSMRRHRAAPRLLIVSSMSLVATMILAVTYAVGQLLERPLVTIPQMIWTHGIANVFGFSLCGLAAGRSPRRDRRRGRARSRAHASMPTAGRELAFASASTGHLLRER
jgi:hypothetical protein